MPERATYFYDDGFFDYIETGARRSARHIIEFIRGHLSVSSVLDIGCGRGVWVDEWRQAGVATAVGVDGIYVDTNRLAVPREHFAAFDVSRSFRLDRRFDLVQTLEVAEHIPPSRADTFVDNLIAHGDVIMFSAAVPGQGGEFHINEQPYGYWRDRFAARDFVLFDFIRPHIAGIRAIEPWYRYNTFLFVSNEAVDKIPAAVSSHKVPPGENILDVAPIPWRIRNLVLGSLPQPVVHHMARCKHAAVRVGLRAAKLNRESKCDQ
jgi:SAM-dependent methyltransferase